MAASSRFIYPYVRVFQDDNSVATGWKLYFYQTGTSTPLDTYNNADLAPGHENTNPVVADVDGQFGAIFLGTVANYKVVLTDENDVVQDTADPVAPPTVGAASTSTAGIIQIATQAQHLAAATTNLATVPQWVANMIQQGFCYATMGGTGDVITATLAPVPAAYAPGMSLRIRMTAANTTAATLNVNSLGAIAVKKRTPAGATALIANDLISGVEYQFDYDSAGSCFWVMEPTTQNVFAAPTAVNFTATNNSGTPNTKIDITAEFAITLDSNNLARIATAVTKTIDASTTGANGLDTGTLANFTAYYIFIIQKPDMTVAGLLSTSATAPSLPSGYTSKVYCGEVLTDGSARFYRTKQLGKKIRYTVTAGSNVAALLQITLANSQTRLAVNLYNAATAVYVPPTAREIALILSSGSTANDRVVVAPSSDVGYNSTTATLGSQPPPIGMDVSLSGAQALVTGELMLETLVTNNPTIYYTSGSGVVGGGATLQVYGWTTRANVS